MSNTFEYLRPASILEACELKAKFGKSASFWAGGTDLLLEWRNGIAQFEYCIDLSYLSDLDHIKQKNGLVHIGSLTRISSLEKHSEFPNWASVLQEVALQFATPQIRNTATIGGNLCHAVPSADYAIALLTLDAEVTLKSLSGERNIPMDEFFTGVKATSLEEDELLTEIRIPTPPSQTEVSFLRITRTTVDIALVNVAVRLTIDDAGLIDEARIALGAVAPTPFRSTSAEALLVGKDISAINNELISEVGRQAAEDTRPITDVRASAAYRREVSKVLVKRGLEQVLENLGGKVA